jgi:DNA-binding transcriptional regulator LsrR (DeoR family)
MTRESNRTLMQVAKLYYFEQLTQAEIGRKLNTSRSTVSRLLQEARDRNIVKITIEYPWERDEELEQALQKTFGLREARVLVAYDQSNDEVRRGMGLLAAEYLDQIFRDDMIVAVSNGRSIASVIEHVKPSRPLNLMVVQLIGALDSGNPLLDGPDLVRNLAEAYGAKYRYMNAPLLVEDIRTRDYLMQEPYVQETLAMARRADVAVLGVGHLSGEYLGTIWRGYLTLENIAWLQSQGGVGHMCAQHFDIQGALLDVELNRRVIGMGISALRNIETVVAIAGGEEKAMAILGAIRGNYLDVLITDDHAAQKMLDLHQSGTVELLAAKMKQYSAPTEPAP